MSPGRRMLLTLGVQLALLFAVAGTYQFDRSTDPHVLLKVGPVDPDSPIKGRYLTLKVEEVSGPSETPLSYPVRVRLRAEQGRLAIIQAPDGTENATREKCGERFCWSLTKPLEFYIPEHAVDPSRGAASLWVDATLPRNGPPRPVALMRQDAIGHFTPILLD